jgi:hypothetical protein
VEEPNEHRDRQGTGDVDENGDLIEALADGLRARDTGGSVTASLLLSLGQAAAVFLFGLCVGLLLANEIAVARSRHRRGGDLTEALDVRRRGHPPRHRREP